MNTFQLGLIKKSLGDSEKFVQNLRGALDLSQDASASKEKVLNLFQDLDSVNNEERHPVDDFRDFTFKSLLVQNFRKYDRPRGGDYFSLTFDTDHKTDSVPKNQFYVFLGDNGSGKSSLFDAMEYVCTGKVSEAEYRKINQDWFLNRMEAVNPKRVLINTSQLSISTADETPFSEEVDVKRFFFSENSIMESSEFMQAFKQSAAETSTNWYDFFLFALGLDKDFIDFISDRPDIPLFNDVCNALRHLKDILSIDGNHTQKSLKDLLVDKATTLTEEQKTHLGFFRDHLDDVQVKWGKGMFDELSLEDLISLIDISYNLNKNFMSVSAVSDYTKQLYDIRNRIPNETTESSKGSYAKRPPSMNLDEERNETISKLKKELFNTIAEYKARFNIILENDEAHFDLTDVIKKNEDIKAWKFVQSHADLANLTVESIDNLLSLLEAVRTNARKEINVVVKDIINEDFCSLINKMFEGTFLKAKENFHFDISNIENEEIKISVNDVPVHKYFNTFRYRLFYLSIQAAINLAKMKREHFSFPMVLDDIFYANDYKNKRQLFRFFTLLEEQADKILPKQQTFQVIFFTHDEQLVSTLNRKKQMAGSTSWKFARIIEYEDFKNILPLESMDENRKSFKVNISIYE